MWARDLEIGLAAWLAVGAFVFDAPAALVRELAVAAIVLALALASYARRTRRAHLGSLGIAAWLIGEGWWTGSAVTAPLAQSHLVVGLVLAMLAVVPSEASRPPTAWRARMGTSLARGRDEGTRDASPSDSKTDTRRTK